MASVAAMHPHRLSDACLSIFQRDSSAAIRALACMQRGCMDSRLVVIMDQNACTISLHTHTQLHRYACMRIAYAYHTHTHTHTHPHTHLQCFGRQLLHLRLGRGHVGQHQDCHAGLLRGRGGVNVAQHREDTSCRWIRGAGVAVSSGTRNKCVYVCVSMWRKMELAAPGGRGSMASCETEGQGCLQHVCMWGRGCSQKQATRMHACDVSGNTNCYRRLIGP